MDNLKRGHRDAVRWGPLVEADIADRSALKEIFEEVPDRCSYSFCRRLPYVGESMQAPELYFQNNVCELAESSGIDARRGR